LAGAFLQLSKFVVASNDTNTSPSSPHHLWSQLLSQFDSLSTSISLLWFPPCSSARYYFTLNTTSMAEHSLAARFFPNMKNACNKPHPKIKIDQSLSTLAAGTSPAAGSLISDPMARCFVESGAATEDQRLKCLTTWTNCADALTEHLIDYEFSPFASVPVSEERLCQMIGEHFCENENSPWYFPMAGNDRIAMFANIEPHKLAAIVEPFKDVAMAKAVILILRKRMADQGLELRERPKAISMARAIAERHVEKVWEVAQNKSAHSPASMSSDHRPMDCTISIKVLCMVGEWHIRNPEECGASYQVVTFGGDACFATLLKILQMMTTHQQTKDNGYPDGLTLLHGNWGYKIGDDFLPVDSFQNSFTVMANERDFRALKAKLFDQFLASKRREMPKVIFAHVGLAPAWNNFCSY
jgi:hypothetical protein